MRKTLKIVVGFLFLASINFAPALAEDDPFPSVNQGSEIPGTRVSGQQNISCASGSGSAIEVNATTHETFTYCVKTWRPSIEINADQDFRDRIASATAIAEAESKAWNAANPGKQKCVQWGPIVHANGISTSSGGVCANPVEPGPNTTLQSQETTGVSGPSTQPQSTTTSETKPSTTPEPSSFNRNSGSGYPFTVIIEGQKSTSECPVGYQAGTGIIAQIGTGIFTECWPENALTAWRLGGTYWQEFKSSGGSFNVQSVLDKLALISDYKAQAKQLAQKAADETPGVQRCSTWSVYGESGQECAYTYVTPTTINTPTIGSPSNSPIGTPGGTSDTSTATTNPLPTTVDSSTAGTLATPTSQEFLSGPAAPSLGVMATTFNGSILQVASLAKKVETTLSGQASVVAIVEKLQKVSTKTYAKSIKLPDLKSTTETAKSLTPEVCNVINLQVVATAKGTCKIEYAITSSSGNTYSTEKVIEFKK